MIGEKCEGAGPTEGRATPYNLQCVERGSLLEKKEFRNEPAPPLRETSKFQDLNDAPGSSSSAPAPKPAKRQTLTILVPFRRDLPFAKRTTKIRME